MFKEKIKEVLELVLEVEEKTNARVVFNYSTNTKDLCIHVIGGHVLIAADNKYMEEDIQAIKDRLKKLIEAEKS